MKFLEPKGGLHLFGAFYHDQGEDDFKKAWEITRYKVEEKISLIDLDDELKIEAKNLYQLWQGFFQRISYDLATPKLYSKSR